MKKMLIAGLGVLTLTTLIGCGNGLSAREEECIKLFGNTRCLSQAEIELKAMERQAQLQGQIAPHNYYGDPRYGEWGNDGSFHFYNPTGEHASATNSFLLGAGLGGLAGYALSKAGQDRGSFTRQYDSYYRDPRYSSDSYRKQQKDQVKINNQKTQIKALEAKNKQLEQDKRKIQSTKDKQINQLKKDQNKSNSSLTKKPSGINLSKKTTSSSKPKPSYSKSYSSSKKY